MFVGAVLDALIAFWNQIVYAVSNMRFPFDIIDILIIAYIIYKAVGFLRESRAGQLVKGIAILLVVYLIAVWWKLPTLNWLLARVVDSLIIAVAVIFQPELRRILERVGRTNFAKGQLFEAHTNPMVECIDSVCKAAGIMQEKKIGALIVFERKTQLGEIINTGTLIDSKTSIAMINNIFFPKSPLHDGAMIIREDRICSAGCILPLTQRQDISSQLGTRHRAAIGMTENSDAVVLVVSEETGIISIVVNGFITRNYSVVSAQAELQRLLIDGEEKENTGFLKGIVNKIKSFKKDGKEESK